MTLAPQPSSVSYRTSSSTRTVTNAACAPIKPFQASHIVRTIASTSHENSSDLYVSRAQELQIRKHRYVEGSSVHAYAIRTT